MNLSWSSSQVRLVTIGALLGLVLFGVVTYGAFDLGHATNVWDAIKNTKDFESILFVNVLIGVSLTLMIIELRLDALRVVLTVVVALIFGYLMTSVFNLDAADRFIRGDFRVKIVTNAELLTNINYGDQLPTKLLPDTPFEGLTYKFAGSKDDVVSILAFADQERDGIDLNVALYDSDGNLLEESTSASSQQMRTFRRYLSSENDAVIEDFTLPATGFYTIEVHLDPDSSNKGEFTVALLSDNPPLVDLAYNGDPVGGTFNAQKDPNPLKRAEYQFAGREGDTISVLAFVFRANVDANLEVKLYAPDGLEIGANKNATQEQVAALLRSETHDGRRDPEYHAAGGWYLQDRGRSGAAEHRHEAERNHRGHQ